LQGAEVSAGHDACVRVRRPAPDRPSQAPRPNPPGNLKALELVGGLLRIGRDLETVLEALELRQ
jgi:hypothetical protein